jgi:glycerol kinase
MGGNVDLFRPTCGLPINTYFSALKMRWLLENSPEVMRASD